MSPNRANTPSSEELVARLRLNDREAFALLYERHSGPSFEYAVRMLADRREAEDVVQDAFLRVFLAARRGGYDPAKGSFRTYLYRILRNLCYDRAATRRPVSASDLDGHGDGSLDPLAGGLADPITPEDQASVRCLRQRVAGALEHLPAMQREALVLRSFEGLSYKEIARVLDRPVAHVKILLFRARRALARWLAAPGAAGGKCAQAGRPAAAPSREVRR